MCGSFRTAERRYTAADSIVSPGDARKVIEWRERAVTLMNASALYGARKYGKDSVLKTFLPTLPEISHFLVLTIAGIRQAARAHPEWGIDELCEFVCTQAQIEQSAQAHDDRWRKTLRYLYDVQEWIAKNLDRLRGSDADGLLVHEMIGSRYSATGQSVEDALRERTELIDPRDMYRLLARHAQPLMEPRRFQDQASRSPKRTARRSPSGSPRKLTHRSWGSEDSSSASRNSLSAFGRIKVRRKNG